MPSRAITKILSQRLAFDLHRVVIYCRTSTHTQEQLNSMTNQVSKLTQLVAENPMWTLCDIYLDFRSGSTIAGRTEFMRLLDDAANRNRSIIPRYRKVVVPGTHTAENHDFISSDQGSRSSISKSLFCSARSGIILSR